MSWFDTLTPDQYRNTITGMNFLSAGFAYNADKAKAAAQKKWQTYSNTMVNISNALNQGVISQNESLAISQSVQEQVNIQRGGLITAAKSEVEAAAAGVKGKSVNQALLDIQANAASRQRTAEIDLNNKLLGYQQQRNQSNLDAVMQKDYSYIPKPSAGTYLLGAAMDTAKLWLQP